MCKLKTYHTELPAGSFYIQSKGLHAGRPLKKPIANCFVVYSDDEHLFSRVYALYVGKFFAYYIGGSVVPFIRIDDVRKLIDQAQREKKDFSKELQVIQQIDQMLGSLHDQIKKYRELQHALCKKVNQSIELR